MLKICQSIVPVIRRCVKYFVDLGKAEPRRSIWKSQNRPLGAFGHIVGNAPRVHFYVFSNASPGLSFAQIQINKIFHTASIEHELSIGKFSKTGVWPFKKRNTDFLYWQKIFCCSALIQAYIWITQSYVRKLLQFVDQFKENFFVSVCESCQYIAEKPKP